MSRNTFYSLLCDSKIFMYCINDEIYKKLDIYIKEYNQKYIKCLVREIEIPISARPEELVRQIFLNFLIKETKLFSNKINIKVEVSNHDIEIYKKPKNDNFKPHQPPLIIVEVKREDVNLQNYYNQIKRYLTKANCDIGILYNYHKIIALTRQSNNFEINLIKELTDIQKLVLPKINSIDNDLLEFEKAQNGNYESFTYLINKYGGYTTNKVVFKIQQCSSEIEGYLFNIQGTKVYYDVCGKYSKKQQYFDYQDFEKLVSITY